ncbi:MAG TPA: hypothetical protein V6D09_23575 [Leptolyngbyaceae cyanobacterium]
MATIHSLNPNFVAKYIMNRKVKFLNFFIATLALSTLTISSVLSQTKLTNQSKVYINGIGAVRVGMTIAEASKAAGTKLIRESGYETNLSCFYVKPQGEPKDIGFMVTNKRISRVDVWKNKSITTLSGAKIGDTESRIRSLYPGQIQVTPHKYVEGGHDLIFIPKDAVDKNYRLLFETDGKRVTRFRSGKLPEVEFVEGCS